MEKKKNEALYVNRHKSLKAHQAAVAARKVLKSGKNVGPVASAVAYGETIKKAKPTAKPTAKPKAKPKAKPATPARSSAPEPTVTRPSPPKTSPKAPKRPNQTQNGASLGSKLSPAEKAKRAKAAKTPNKPAYRSGRNALAARNAEKNKTRSYKDPRSETRTRYVRTAGGGKKAVPEIKVNGKWVKAGGKG